MRTKTKKLFYLQSYYKKYCRICGEEIKTGKTCESCEAFIKQKQKEERRAKK